MVIAALITMIILTAVACHTHCHLKTPFWKQEELLTPTTHNFIWKELLAYGTCAHSTVRLKTVKFKKTRQLFLLGWKIPPVLSERINFPSHLVMGVSNPLHPQNSTLIQPVTHVWCCFVIRDNERPNSTKRGPNQIPWATPNSLCCCTPFSAFPRLTPLSRGSFLSHSLYIYLPCFLYSLICVCKYI